jgi:hypothetical protein
LWVTSAERTKTGLAPHIKFQTTRFHVEDLLNDEAVFEAPVIVCDAVQTMGVHNGVARLGFVRLQPDGTAIPSLELLLPVETVAEIVKALQSVNE